MVCILNAWGYVLTVYTELLTVPASVYFLEMSSSCVSQLEDSEGFQCFESVKKSLN